MWTLKMMRRTVYQTAITTRLGGGGPRRDGWSLSRLMYFLETGGSRGRGHPPDSQSLLKPEHHPTQSLVPLMETVFH